MQKVSQEKKLAIVGSISVLLAIVFSVGMSWVLYEHTVTLLTENLRQRLLSIVTTAVVQIDGDELKQLKTEQDWKTSEWRTVVTQLKKIKDNNKDIVFTYIFRKKEGAPNEMEFVADAESINPYANTDSDPTNDIDANKDGKVEPDGPDALQWPGQDYPEPPEETFLAYNGALTSKDLYTDSFGSVLTGYAPILDKNGNVAAVLGVDIRADDFFSITRQTLQPFLIFIGMLILVIFVLSSAIISVWNRRVKLLAEIDRQKDELLSIVSHQLATPIASVRWYIEMLLDGDLGVLTDEQKAQLETVMHSSQNLSDLVSMILDVSRIQLGRMKIEKQTLDLNEFFKEIYEVVDPKATEKHIHFNKKMPKQLPKAELDRRYTHMTIENLMTNAIKYTPEGGNVDVTVDIQDNWLHVTVKDTGCGIPIADQSNIFGKMFRASNVRNSAIDGNGFGLYVAKGAVESQGGQIWFQSTEGKGTTFYVKLPLLDSLSDVRS